MDRNQTLEFLNRHVKTDTSLPLVRVRRRTRLPAKREKAMPSKVKPVPDGYQAVTP
jgi:hypothetical protein